MLDKSHLPSRLFGLFGFDLQRQNITNRQYSVIDVNTNEAIFKLRNYIYHLTCTDSGVQYVGENITPLNKRMSIHRKGKSRCRISINNDKNVCKNASFTIQITEKLPGNG